MPMALFAGPHKKIQIVSLILCAIIGFLLSHSACRDDLYDAAKQAYDARSGEALAYSIAALVEDSGYTKVLLSDGKNILQSIQAHTGAPNGQVYLDPRGWVFVTQGMMIHALGPEGRYVMYNGFAITPIGFAEENGSTVTMVNKIIYRFEAEQNPPWQPMYDYTADSRTFISLFRASDGSGSYVVYSNTEPYQYEFYDLSLTSINYVTGSVSFNPLYYDYVDGNFWVGGNDGSYTLLKNSSSKISNYTEMINDYAIVDSSNIFAAGSYSGFISLLKGGAGVDFSLYENFSSSSGTMHIKVFDPSTLVLGLNATSNSMDGLYTYSISEKKYTQLSTLPVYGISTLRK